jgi:SAM-dependent methyltransferase
MLEYHLNATVDAASRNHDFIERSVEWICGQFNVSRDFAIADFGCGPGLYANRLAQKGALVTGIDFSSNSLEYARKTARKNGLNVRYVHANYLNFESDQPYDLIIMIMCDFCVLSPGQRKQLLSKLRSLLNPGGHILLDVYTLIRFNAINESASYELNQLDGFWSPDDYYCFVNTFKYEEDKVILDKYTIVEPSGMKTVYNWLQHYSPESLKSEFEENGLRIEEFYSDVAGRRYDATSEVIAVKANRA